MTRLIVGAVCLLSTCLSATAPNAFERARPKRSALEVLLAQKVKISPCYRKARHRSAEKHQACDPVERRPSVKSGFADISVLDENDNAMPGFCVRVNGRVIGPAPRSGVPLDPGNKVIEVHHQDVGDACQQVKIKSSEVSMVVFQFVRLPEKVAQLSTKAVNVQRYGTIVVMNALANTEVYVDPEKAVADAMKDLNAGKPDKRVSKGKGSLKISNLVPDTYVVEVKELQSKDAKPNEISVKPGLCGGGPCKIEVALDTCYTMRVEVRPDGISKSKVSEKCRGGGEQDGEDEQ